MVTRENKQGNYIYFLKEGECVIKKMVEVDRHNALSGKTKASKTAQQLDTLNLGVGSNQSTSDMMTICSLQRGATIGEECLYPESKYFYTVIVKSSSATFLILNKTTSKGELDHPHMQLSINLQRKFLQKK